MKKYLILILCAVLFTGVTAHAGGLVLIVNKSVYVSSMSLAELQNVFLGKTVLWPDGKKIKVCMLKAGDTHDKFLNDVLGMSNVQFDTYWKQVIFTGKGRPPQTVDTEEEMVNYVTATEGAVGYIDSGTSHSEAYEVEVKTSEGRSKGHLLDIIF